jgi:hypothetical protein
MCSLWDSAKIFFTPKFSYLLLSNPTHKAKLGLQQVGPTNSNPPGPIKVYSECAVPFTSISNILYTMLRQFSFAKPNQPILTFLHLISFGVHIPNTGGEMLLVNLFEISVSCRGAFPFLKLF